MSFSISPSRFTVGGANMYRPTEANGAIWDYLDRLALGCGSPTEAPEEYEDDDEEADEEFWTDEMDDCPNGGWDE
jgi:hypothetical protein